MKFSLLPYSRPDFEAAKQFYTGAAERLKAAVSFEQAESVFLEVEKFSDSFDTLCTIANIRHDIDTRDGFYDAEVAYFNENLPALIPVTKAFTEAIVNGPFRADFEREYGAHFIRLLENSLLVQDARIIGDLVRESELSVAYSKAAAACKTEFRGETCNFYGLLKHMESTDRAERREAFEKWAALYADASAELDAIYDELVAVRAAMAEKLGFESYTALAYRNRQRLDYTPEHVEKFREQVRTVVTPAVARMFEAQAKRLGVDKLRYYDESLVFPGGNAHPIGGKDDMLRAAQHKLHRRAAPAGSFPPRLPPRNVHQILRIVCRRVLPKHKRAWKASAEPDLLRAVFRFAKAPA